MKFMAFDGTVFDTMAECEKYERRSDIVEKNVLFLKATGTDITNAASPLYADYVVIKGKVDPEVIEELFDCYDCYCDGLDSGIGAYYWDDDKEKWIKIYHRICELENEIEEIADTIERYTELENQIKAEFLN